MARAEPKTAPFSRTLDGSIAGLGSWSLSLLIHVTILVVLAIFPLFQGKESPFSAKDEGTLEEQSNRSAEDSRRNPATEKARSVRILAPPYQLKQTGVGSSASANLQTGRMDPAQPFPGDAAPFTMNELLDWDSNQALPLPTADIDGPSRSLSESFRPASFQNPELSESDLAEIEQERERLKSLERVDVGPGATATFFGGPPIHGHRFVFVIDRSKSMGSKGLNALEMVAQQLENQLQEFGENHKIQIVAYHHRPIFMGRRAWLAVTDDAREMAPQFIRSLPALGGTNHESAIFAGLSFEPDVLLLLTDGEHPPLTQAQLQDIRDHAKGVQIHCIRFGNKEAADSGPHFMEQLAVQNGGTYRFVNVLEPR